MHFLGYELNAPQIILHRAVMFQRPFARMERLGVINPNLIAAHCTHLTDGEIASLTKHGSSVAHCPS